MADSTELFLRQFQRGSLSAPPSAGTFQLGDFFWNDTPGAGKPLGWICSTSGTPGTWRPVVTVQDDIVTTVSAAGTVTFQNTLVDIDTGGFNVTVTQPTTLQNGAVIQFLNNTASPVTLVASAGTLYAGSAVISANTSAQVRAQATNMYRIA